MHMEEELPAFRSACQRTDLIFFMLCGGDSVAGGQENLPEQ
jgi:hypothetical protein